MNRESSGSQRVGTPARTELRARASDRSWTRVQPSVEAALEQLTTSGGDEQELLDLVGRADRLGLAQWMYCLTELGQQGRLEHTIFHRGQPMLAFRPVGGDYRYPAPTLDHTCRYQLAPYAHVHRRDDALVLECAPGQARVRLGGGALRVISALCRPATVSELLLLAPLLTESVVALFVAGGLVVPANEAEAPWELAQWLAHRWSRSSDPNHPLGAVFPMPMGLVVPPARPAIVSVDWLAARSNEPSSPDSCSLGELLASPPAGPGDAAAPVNVDQLFALLFRTQRVLNHVQRREQTPLGEVEVEYAPRPYPNGGSLYELEVYVVTSQCEGLPDGVYWYDGWAHRFGRVGDLVGGGPTRLVVTGRISRRSWRYSGTAYSNMLKNAGVLVEFLQLWGRTLDIVCYADTRPHSELLNMLIDGDGVHADETVVATVKVGSALRHE